MASQDNDKATFEDLDHAMQVAWIEKLIEDDVLPLIMAPRGVSFRKGNRTTLATTKDLDDMYKEAWGREYAKHEDYVPSDLVIETLSREQANQADARLSTFERCDTAMDYVVRYMEREKIKATPQNTLEQMSAYGNWNPLPVPVFLTDLQVSGDNFNRSIPLGLDGKAVQRPLNLDILPKAFDSWLKARQRTEFHSMQYDMRYRPELAGDLDTAVDQILNAYWYESPLDKIMFKHMLWSIKRRIYNKPVPYDVFFSFYGKEGGIGKSKLMRDLVPMINMYAQVDLNMLKDINTYFALSQDRYLFNFDELRIPESSNTDQDKAFSNFLALLKSIITGEEITVRRFQTQQAMTIVKTVVMGSTSQFPLYELICDETGMRKFWSFESKAPKGAGQLCRFKEAFPWIKGEGLYKLYSMIDEEDEFGYFHPERPGYAEISAVQASYAKQDQITRFLAKIRMTPCDKGDEGATQVPFTKFCQDFRRWRKSYDSYVPGSKTIEMMMRSSQGVSLQTNKRSGIDYYLLRAMSDEELGIDVTEDLRTEEPRKGGFVA